MRRYAGIFVITLALIGAGVMPATATLPSGTLKNKIQQVGEDLDNANAEVAAAMKNWRKAASALPAAKSRLARAKAALAAAQAADHKAFNELTDATNRTHKAETDLSTTKSNLESQRLEVSQLVRTMYMQGPNSEWALMIGATTPAEFTSLVESITRWNSSKESLIATLAKTREDLTLKTEQLKVLKSEKEQKKQVAEVKVLTAAQAAAEARKAQKKVDALVAQKAAALKIAMKNRNKVLSRYKALKKEQERLKRLAAGIEDGGFDGGSDLLWPIPGAHITQVTGWRTHPVYGYRSCHTGIDLGASSGTPIRAAESGVVVVANFEGPYGRYTLINHGDGLSTFYAHQSVQLVNDGDFVKRGEVIGKVGSTGWSTGAHLHFEVRVKGVPYNPLGWFGGKKEKVSCVD